MVDLIKSGRYIDIFLCQNMRNNKNKHSGGVSCSACNWDLKLWPLKEGWLLNTSCHKDTKTGYDTFILIVIVHPLPVSFWLLVDFVKDSLVDICWERADLLAFCLFCFTLWYLKIVPPPVPCPPPSPPSPPLCSSVRVIAFSSTFYYTGIVLIGWDLLAHSPFFGGFSISKLNYFFFSRMQFYHS